MEEHAQRLLRDIEIGGQLSRKYTYINCWHENEHESEAMWKLYSNFLPNALVVRSTYGKLYRSLGRNPSIDIGRVKYISLNTEYAGINNAFWRKRKSFEHEREIRALLVDRNFSNIGKPMPCDLNELVEEIILSPQAPSWFPHIVADVCKKYGLEAKVTASRLNDAPFF